MKRIWIFAIAATAGSLAGCRSSVPPRTEIAPEVAACVPERAVLLAGFQLEELRASPFFAKLPPALLELVEPYAAARSLAAASSGRDLLLIASGAFPPAPPGTTLAGRGLALAGSPDLVQSATAPHPASPLLAEAESIARGKQIWIVARGGASLPLSGNAANVNRLLHDMDYAALTVHLASSADLAVTARGHTAEAARRFEGTLRATFTMAAVGEARHSRLATLLRSIAVQREDRMVRATLSVSNQDAPLVFALLTP